MVATTVLPGAHGREPPRPPPPAVAEAERQWLFTEEELLQTPSILDGMPAEEERTLRRKGVNFILQVGMMLKLPQTTIGTAAVFMNRFMMRNSLKARPGYKPLHHYQVAATALFLATKVEENCRKLKELVTACVRVALKDPNKLVDEQTKDFWKWRDTILYSEDLVLESLCFDLSIETPYLTMYEMLKYYGIEHNKPLRNAAWAFLSDSNLTQLCLLFSARTIAACSLYAAARLCEIELPDYDGSPWWAVQHVELRDIRVACNLMADTYEQSDNKDGEASIYVGLRSPIDELDSRRPSNSSLTNGQVPEQMTGVEMAGSAPPTAVNGNTNTNTNSGNGNGNGNATGSGNEHIGNGTNPDNDTNPDTGSGDTNGGGGATDDGSEEGELDG